MQDEDTTENQDIVLTEVAVRVRMDTNGTRYVETDYTDETPTWEVLGLLQVASDQIRDQIRSEWRNPGEPWDDAP